MGGSSTQAPVPDPMPLASRWAEDPELVHQAEEQDKKSKVATSKKGQKLVSRWADDDDDDDDAEEVKIAVKSPKNNKELAARIAALKSEIAPKEHKQDTRQDQTRQPKNTSHAEGQDQDDDHKVEPTKGAIDFASRLGISLATPKEPRHQERQKNKDKKLDAGSEWDRSKRPERAHHREDRLKSPKKEPVTFKREKDHISFRRDPPPVSFKKDPTPGSLKKDKESKPKDRPKREHRGKSRTHKEEIVDDQPKFDQEEFDKLFAREKKLNEDIANGLKVDWATMDDDWDY